MNAPSKRPGAFTMVEIVLALGIVVFALLALLALLPVGIKSNQISTEETQAASLITLLEADLRNTHPAANNGKSQRFGLTLPYMSDTTSSTRLTANTAFTLNTLYTTGVLESGSAAPLGNTPRPHYQVSVIYTRKPASGNQTPVHARLVVNWPPLNTTNAALLTSGSVSGFVETYVTFPMP